MVNYDCRVVLFRLLSNNFQSYQKCLIDHSRAGKGLEFNQRRFVYLNYLSISTFMSVVVRSLSTKLVYPEDYLNKDDLS